MAKPTCLKCGTGEFELVLVNMPETSTRKLNFVQCKKCGGVVGVLGEVNLDVAIQKVQFVQEQIAARIGSIIDWHEAKLQDAPGTAQPGQLDS